MYGLIVLLEVFAFYITFINVSRVKLEIVRTVLCLAILAVTLVLVPYLSFLYLAINENIIGIIYHIIFVVVMAMFTHKNIQIIRLNIFYGVLAKVIFLLARYTVAAMVNFTFAIITIDNVIAFHPFVTLSYSTVIVAICYLISKYTGKFLQARLVQFDDVLKRKFASYLLVGASITCVMLVVATFLYYIVAEATLFAVYAILLSLQFGFLIGAIFSFTDNFKKAEELRHKDEMLANLKTYTSAIENMSTDVRKFRHDHINLLVGMKGYIDVDDMDGVREYFYKYMPVFKKETATLDSRLDILANIKTMGIKSIISSKLLYAIQLGTEVYIEVPEPIDDIDTNHIVDICRILGTLIDNAIEATLELETATIRFLSMRKDNKIFFIISNNCKKPPKLFEISQKGFTTKGEGRGTGLDTVATILEKNENLLLVTKINEDTFIQKLMVLLPKNEGDRHAENIYL
ncbi:MAG: GHKL domain-containing protein [Firmicutes bacterium]|nr:GHKL domain-containing protein [Bacillota bacterium]